MNKKVFKILTVVLAVLLIVGFAFTTVHAAKGTMIDPGKLDEHVEYVDNPGMLEMAGRVMGFIRNISVIGGVIILMILGVKYMTGSLEEKADYKKSLIPLVVGILVVMAATTIMSFVINFFNK